MKKKTTLLIPILLLFALFIFLALQNSNQTRNSDSNSKNISQASSENNLIQPKTIEPEIDSKLQGIENEKTEVEKDQANTNLGENNPNQTEADQNNILSTYSLTGNGCNENTSPSKCDLVVDSNSVLSLKECFDAEVNTNCNLYSYRIQKETDTELYIFKEYTDDRGVQLLEVLEHQKGTKNTKNIQSVINDPTIPASVVDYNSVFESYKKQT